MDVPNPDRGLAHGLIWKAESMVGLSTPVVPVLLNCHYAPQISARRSFEIGSALRQVIDEDESDLRVAVVGTGGLWHTPGAPDAYLDEDFDHAILARLKTGDIAGMADFFDDYSVSPEDASQSLAPAGSATTGMIASAGPQGGTRQVCNWVAAAATAEVSHWTVVDYVPVYASPIGAAFAYSLGAS
jgi:aromatic ring-opening dioxygenase catalytic subunit (LigB family)